MIIGLTALIIYLFGGGQEMFFLNPEIKKNVRTYVADKKRKEEINAIIKQTETAQKNFLKKKKKYYAEKSSELNLNYSSQREDFEKLFDEYFDERKKLQSTYIDNEMKIRSLIKEDEWTKIVGQVLVEPDNKKSLNTYMKTSEKLFGGILNTCEKTMADAGALKEAQRLVKEQKAEVDHFVDEFVNLNYKKLEPLRNLNATRSDFESAATETNELRRKILSHLIDLRFKLAGLTSAQEWKKLGKALDKLFTKGKNVV